MVISKRIDYRKRKGREVFFGMPFLPLLVFLLLIIVLLILPPASMIQPSVERTAQVSEFYNIPITGAVVSGLNMTKTQYSPGKSLEGDFVVRFYPSDLIPWNATANFSITSIKCKHYYVCSFGDKVPWEKYNKTLGRCVNVSNWINGPWSDECLENYNVYPCAGNVTCCAPGMGQGSYYYNLNCTGNKECWDKCASVTEKKLIDLIALSNSPYNGNYTIGNYYNANASGSSGQLSGYGIGFGYCYPSGLLGQRYYGPGVTGYAAGGGSQPSKPDLFVEKIYIQEFGTQPPSPPRQASGVTGVSGGGISGGTKKVYAKIKNNGTSGANNFVVRAEWNSIPYMPSPGNSKEENVAYLGPGQNYTFEINNLESIKNLELTVTVDYYNSVNETNEDNNEKRTFLGCLDIDGNNTQDKAKCYDFTEQYVYEDYCDSDVEERLYEYTCQPPMYAWPFDKVCSATLVSCEQGCEDGRCISAQPMCRDTDNDNITNPDPFVFGSCYIEGSPFPVRIDDQCKDSYILIEQDCNQDQCQGTEINCTQYGMVCFNGACQSPPKPDLIIEKIGRSSDFKKAKITIKNIGNETVSTPFSLFINITEGVNAVEIIPITSSLGPGANYSKESATNIEGKSVRVTAVADFYNNVSEENEGNNNKTDYLLPYTCDNWLVSNVYRVDLGSSLNLKAPSVEGIYLLNVSFNYGNINMSKSSIMLTVAQPQTKKACRNNECTLIECYPPNCNDTCSSNSDCREPGGCYENWQFTTWTECINGRKQRECYDANNCGTTEVKPLACLQVGTKFIETQNCCVQAWSCDEWSACYEDQGAWIQSMTCNDLNRCNAQNVSYTQLRECCSEDWQCTWSPCINGFETLTCQELNNCGTNFTKPQEQSRGCKVSAKAAVAWWVVMIIIIAIIVVTVIVLFATNVIKLPKKGGVTKGEVGAEAVGVGAYPELTNYIKSAISAGMSRDEIKRKLIEAGWPQDTIDSELSKV
ncbi:MAG: CARDB domain-containing protein [Candidatus Pacearchaeota archaeon]